MKTPLSILLSLFLFTAIQLTFSGCSRTTSTQSSDTDYNAIFSTPPSEFTPEQQSVTDALLELLPTGIEVKDNQLVTTLKKEDFNAKNIPLYYYDMLMKNISEVNEFARENAIDIEAMWQTMMKQMSAGLPE